VHHDLGRGIEQIEVEPSARHLAAEARLRRLTDNVSITDIAASVLWSASPGFVRELRHALRGATAVVAVQPYLASAVRALDDRIPLVYDAHNHELALKSQMLPDDEAGRWMLARVGEAEDLATSQAALVVATTADDLDALTRAPARGSRPSDTAIVPNGVDTTRVRRRADHDHDEAHGRVLAQLRAPADTTHIALFVGSAHRPNIVAGRAIAQLAPQLPHVLFVLAGRHTDQLDHDVATNVRLLGEVSRDRLEDLLAAADVALNPMVTGGGSNLKVLEYFAAGVPVVTTLTGARGVPDPETVAHVVDAGDMARGIQESLDTSNRDRVDAARRLVERDFDWSRLGEQFAGKVDRVLRDLGHARSTRPREQERHAPQ
jgi:glycosyltransferase involved in cell wall biosynthesis